MVALHARSGSLASLWVGPLPGSNSRRTVGDQTCIPNSLMCKKHTSASHSSSEAELTSLDAGLIMHALRAVEVWDCVLPTFILTCQILILWLILFLPTFLDHLVLRSFTFLKTTEAVIRMITSGRSPSLRHVARTHKVNLDWLLREAIWTLPLPLSTFARTSIWQIFQPKVHICAMEVVDVCICSHFFRISYCVQKFLPCRTHRRKATPRRLRPHWKIPVPVGETTYQTRQQMVNLLGDQPLRVTSGEIGQKDPHRKLQALGIKQPRVTAGAVRMKKTLKKRIAVCILPV